MKTTINLKNMKKPNAIGADDSPLKNEYQLIVFGATPAGIACAVRAAREGLAVLLVNRSPQIGGMFSNGLSVMDTLYAGARSPLYDELRRAIHDHYRITYGPDSPQFAASRPGHPKTYYEAHVAERLLTEMIKGEPGITLIKGFEPKQVLKEGAVIQKIVFGKVKENVTFAAAAPVFADCSYEADLAVMAGAGYRTGREARNEFNEEYAGKIFMKRAAWPPPNVDPKIIEDYKKLNLFHYDRWFEILRAESTGEADNAVQAFNIRAVLTTDPANRRIPDAPPPGYDADAMKKVWSEKPQYSQLLGPLPNNKYLWNMPELLGPQHAYPDGDWDAREHIIELHRRATAGMLYFLQNDPSVSPQEKEEWQKLGFALDEFTDNDNLPREVYARETRRIKGRKVFTENDARLATGSKRTPVHADSISITEWFLDVHPCNADKRGDSLYEGEIYLNYVSHPGQVPYRTLLPEGIDNLFVPVCLSCTHVGWGAIRLEPTWMSIAEAAAHATVVAVERGLSPAQLNTDELVRRLAERRVMVSFFNDVPLDAAEPWVPAVQYFGTQGFFGSYDAKPGECLTVSVAKAWAKAAAEWIGGTAVDGTERARQILTAEQTHASSITETEFVELLCEALANYDTPQVTEALQKEAAGFSVQPISRGKACRLMFDLGNAANGRKHTRIKKKVFA